MTKQSFMIKYEIYDDFDEEEINMEAIFLF